MRAIICSSIAYTLTCTTLPAAAQNISHGSSLGIEVPVLAIRHESVASVGTTTTDMGVFGLGAGLNGQYALSNRTILGARLSLSRQTYPGSVAHSQISLLPRFEYHGAPERPVRPHIGIEVGLERETATANPAKTRFLFGPTFGIAYFPVEKWMLDFNGSLFLAAGSWSASGASGSTSGYGFLVRVNLAKWFGGEDANSDAAPTGYATATQAPGAQQPAAAPTAPSAPATPVAQVAAGFGTADTAPPTAPPAEPTGADVQPAANARVTLDLHEGRRLTLVALPAGAEKRVKFILVKAPLDESLKSCSTVELHAPKQTLSIVGTRYKQLSTASGEVSTLSAEISVDNLKPLILAPESTKPPSTPDHWIGICGQNWPLSTLERRQLKDYLGRL